MWTRRLAVWGILLAAGSVLAGDPDVAELLYEKGKRAARSREWKEAESYFRRALTEYSPLPHAHEGLGEALENQDRIDEAIAAYRRCIAEVEAMESPSSAGRRASFRAKRAIRRIERRFAPLERLDREFARRFVAYARKWREEAPAWARKACATALRLDTDRKAAQRMLDELGDAPAPTSTTEEPRDAPRRKPEGTPLVESDEMAEWDPGITGAWSCDDGVIVGDVDGSPGKLNWHEGVLLEGRYTLVADFRMTRGGPRKTYGIFFGSKGLKETRNGVLVTFDDQVVLVLTKDDHSEVGRDWMLRDFDRREWHTVRVDVDGGEVAVHLNGEKLFDFMARERTAFDGGPGVFVQDARVEIRNLRVLR